MDDPDEKVRAIVGTCFLQLQSEQRVNVRQFMIDFKGSASLEQGAAHLAAYVGRVAKYDHDLALQVTDAVQDAVEHERARGDAPPFGTPLTHVLSDEELVRLPITVYMKTRDNTVKRNAMDRFDRLLMLGSYQAYVMLGDWDRR